MGTGMGMVDRKWEGNGNSSLEEISVSRVNHILALYFSTGYRDLTVLWLTSELAYIVVRLALHYYYFTNLALNCFWCLHCFSGVVLGDGTKYQNLNGNGNKNINTREWEWEWELTKVNGREWEYWLCSRTPLPLTRCDPNLWTLATTLFNILNNAHNLHCTYMHWRR